MTQDEKWVAKYNEALHFIETNKRNPSKHRIEEHLMLNFIKHNRKLMNAGAMKPEGNGGTGTCSATIGVG